MLSIQTGISKSVRANSGIYSHADAVNPDGEYTYRILVQTTDKGVTKDLSKAAKLYLQAEALGHLTPESAKNLAECYAKKIGILPDLANAEKRIEQLKKHKQNDSLVTMLRTIK